MTFASWRSLRTIGSFAWLFVVGVVGSGCPLAGGICADPAGLRCSEEGPSTPGTDRDGDGFDESTDCDDADASVNPQALESCLTTADDDCDGAVDADGALGCSKFLADADADDFGQDAGLCRCEPLEEYRATVGGDCNDSDPSIHPDAVETCDGVDQDCDGTADNGLVRYYEDLDRDGFGVGVGNCDSVTGTTVEGDCDDLAATVYPGAPELCDGSPNDCDAMESWTPANEDLRVSYQSSAGAWSDVSSIFSTSDPVDVLLASAGTYRFCSGRYYTRLIATGAALELVGIYGASATVLDGRDAGGSTVFVENGSVTLSGFTVTGGQGTTLESITYGGGLLVAAAGSAPTEPTVVLESCIITGDTANYGGGVATAGDAWLHVQGSYIEYNSSNFGGGGVHLSEGSTFTVEDSEISYNESAYGGALREANGRACLVTIERSTVANNSAYGAGAFLLNGGSLSLVDTVVSGNSATSWAGGLSVEDTEVTCTSSGAGGVYDNSAQDGGGVILQSGGSFVSVGCDLGEAGLDNTPDDVQISGGESYTSYGAASNFSCSNASGACAP